MTSPRSAREADREDERLRLLHRRLLQHLVGDLGQQRRPFPRRLARVAADERPDGLGDGQLLRGAHAQRSLCRPDDLV